MLLIAGIVLIISGSVGFILHIHDIKEKSNESVVKLG
jgi:preprotein translocase subunit Sss1